MTGWTTRRWIEPHPSLRQNNDRRRARLMAATLLALIVLGALVDLIFFALEFSEGTAPEPGLLVAEVLIELLLIIGYFFARSTKYQIAGLFLIGVPLGSLWSLWFIELGNADALVLLFYLAIPIMMIPFALRPRPGVILILLNLVALGSLEPYVAARLGFEYVRTEFASVFWFLVMVSAIAIVAARLIERDLRALERSEQALKAANDRLEAVDRERLQLVNNVAHDLASPLTPVKIQTSLLEEGHEGTPEQRAKRFAVIRRNIEQVERLIEDLRDSAKLESSQMKLRRQTIDLGTLIRDACEALRPKAEDRGLRLECQVTGSLPAEVDPQRVTQVLYNLLTNALKFTPSGGSVAVKATSSGGRARVRVTDSGRGLTPEEISRLFHPFSQVHAPQEIPERGTGLGLFISRGLIEVHGGRLMARSDGRDRGSTFEFELPLATTSSAGGKPPKALGAQSGAA